MKGGHRTGAPLDLLVEHGRVTRISGPRPWRDRARDRLPARVGHRGAARARGVPGGRGARREAHRGAVPRPGGAVECASTGASCSDPHAARARRHGDGGARVPRRRRGAAGRARRRRRDRAARPSGSCAPASPRSRAPPRRRRARGGSRSTAKTTGGASRGSWSGGCAAAGSAPRCSSGGGNVSVPGYASEWALGITGASSTVLRPRGLRARTVPGRAPVVLAASGRTSPGRPARSWATGSRSRRGLAAGPTSASRSRRPLLDVEQRRPRPVPATPGTRSCRASSWAWARRSGPAALNGLAIHAGEPGARARRGSRAVRAASPSPRSRSWS